MDADVTMDGHADAEEQTGAGITTAASPTTPVAVIQTAAISAAAASITAGDAIPTVFAAAAPERIGKALMTAM